MVEHSEKNLDPQEDQNEGAVSENVEVAATGDAPSPETEETREPVTAEEKQPETLTESEPEVAAKPKEKSGKTTKGRKTKAQADDAEPSAPAAEQEFDWEKYEEGSNFYSKNET